jgi:hypothetical protein
MLLSIVPEADSIFLPGSNYNSIMGVRDGRCMTGHFAAVHESFFGTFAMPTAPVVSATFSSRPDTRHSSSLDNVELCLDVAVEDRHEPVVGTPVGSYCLLRLWLVN